VGRGHGHQEALDAPNGFAERANVIIDETGRVAWIKVYEVPETPDIQEVLDVLSEM